MIELDIFYRIVPRKRPQVAYDVEKIIVYAIAPKDPNKLWRVSIGKGKNKLRVKNEVKKKK